MKITLKFSLFFFVLFTLGNESLALNDFQIKRFCQKEKRKLTCIKSLQEKRSNLKEGKLIEIPVIPHKR